MAAPLLTNSGRGTLRVRAFFGLPVPEAHRRLLGPYLDRCAAAAPDFRWVAAGNLHLTVRFLGHVERSQADSIATVLERDGLSGFELQLGPLGAFKRGRLARVVWVGLAAGGEAAAALAERVETRCRQAGLEPETRAFSAHLTLARARAPQGAQLPALGARPSVAPWRAQELVLYRSQMGRGGSVYEPLRTITLR